MPLGKDVSANIKELNRSHPEWPRDKKLAVALQAARDAGHHIPHKPVKRKSAVKRKKR